MSLSGDGQPRRLFPAEIEARNAQLSPDGRWVASETTVDSRSEIFVAPFRGEGERRMVSTDGGEMPLWSRDGRELFFTSGKGLMVVAVSSGDTLTAGTPRVLHAGPFSIYSINASTGYAVTPDGDRLLSIRPVAEDQNIRQIEVVFNWLKSR
jgi:Tol biopolymer transport system component